MQFGNEFYNNVLVVVKDKLEWNFLHTYLNNKHVSK